MRLPLLAALTAVMLLTACGGFRESRLNPRNWFGRSEPVDRVLAEAPADPRPMIDQVLMMVVEPYPGGAIVRATGLPPTQGYWDAALEPLPMDENGVLVYEFRIFPPIVPRRAGTQPSREITAAASLSDIALQGVTQIVVQGAQNARASRR